MLPKLGLWVKVHAKGGGCGGHGHARVSCHAWSGGEDGFGSKDMGGTIIIVVVNEGVWTTGLATELRPPGTQVHGALLCSC